MTSLRRDSESDDDKLLKHDTGSDTYLHQERKDRRHFPLLVLCFLINLTWTSVLLWNSATPQLSALSPGPPNLIFSPAREAVKYEIVETNTTIESTNICTGKPPPEQTLAWEEITKWRNIAESKEDLEMIVQDSIGLADGSGYMATLEVFHQIHCLDFIRMYICRDYYDTHETERLRWAHVDRCIEVLRASAMCHGVISLVTWQWVDRQELPFANFKIKHECRSWKSILE